MRPLVIDGVKWFWRSASPYNLDQLVVFREDRRTMLWYSAGQNARVRVERRPKDELEGLFVVPALPALIEPGPGAAAALARWIESDAPKARIQQQPTEPPPRPEWRSLRSEGRRWFAPEGDEEPVRAVIEELLQRPVIAPFLRSIEEELGPRATRQLTSECLEALVARGVLDESWLRPDARRVAVDEQGVRDDAPLGFRSLRALWALASAPRAALEAERLAREFEQRFLSFVSADRLGDGPAELSWLVVDSPRVASMPVTRPGGGPLTFDPMHEWWSVVVQLPTEALLALVEWPPAERPLEAYRSDASSQHPLLKLCWQHAEEARVWRELAEREARIALGDRVEDEGVSARWAGKLLSEVPALCEPTAAITRAGFALWSALPWRMVLMASVQP